MKPAQNPPPSSRPPRDERLVSFLKQVATISRENGVRHVEYPQQQAKKRADFEK